MSIRNFITKLLLCSALLLSSSCITKYVWGDKKYEEVVDKFFVGADGRYVVLVGGEFHYVFSDDNGLLKTILSLKQRGILTVDEKKTYMKLENNNDVAGFFVIEGPFSILPPEDSYLLTSLGYRPDKHDRISIKIKLTGRRYQSRYLNQMASEPGSTSYRIPIYYHDSNLVKDVGKIAVTPVAVTLDAVLLIGKIIVYPMTL